MNSPIHHCGTCTECMDEPRASRAPENTMIVSSLSSYCVPRSSVMPEHLPSVDPLFLDGVFRMFTPEEKEMVKEKAGLA